MCACRVVSCRANRDDDEDDSDDDDDDDVVVESLPKPRPRTHTYHKPEVFTPPPEPTLKKTIKKYRKMFMKSVHNSYVFCESVYNDPFRWQLYKSIVFFTIGLKMSSELSRYMNSPDVKCGTF